MANSSDEETEAGFTIEEKTHPSDEESEVGFAIEEKTHSTLDESPADFSIEHKVSDRDAKVAADFIDENQVNSERKESNSTDESDGLLTGAKVNEKRRSHRNHRFRNLGVSLVLLACGSLGYLTYTSTDYRTDSSGALELPPGDVIDLETKVTDNPDKSAWFNMPSCSAELEPEAFETCLKASCARDEIRGCARLGRAHFAGTDGVSKDFANGTLLMRRMCKRGDGWSCSKLGYNIKIWIGSSGKVGLAESEALLKIAAPLMARLCDRGDSTSCHQLASQLFRGDGVTKNEDRAVTLAKKSCDLNDEDGCFRLATFHNVEGGDKQQFLDGLQRACDMKSGAGCAGLAVWYEHGTIGVFKGSDGSSKDLPRAWRLYEKACALRSGVSCGVLGAVYDDNPADGDHSNNESGFAKDVRRANQLYRKSCKLGFSLGCYRLGAAYYQGGNGVRLDKLRAHQLFEKACDLGVDSGCHNAAAMYHNQLGMGESMERTQRINRANQLFTRACELGHEEACKVDKLE